MNKYFSPPKGILPPRATHLIWALLAGTALLVLSIPFQDNLYLHIALIWNIFLAALPLLFAILLLRRSALQKRGVLSILSCPA